MRMITTVGACALALIMPLAGCGTATEEKTGATAATSTLPAPDMPKGPNMTIADYVDQNKFVESPVAKDQPGAPVVHFALPPGWEAAGSRKPEWAYGAIVYTAGAGGTTAGDPPFMTAIYNKLSGDVEPAKILEYAPGLLQNLPGYSQDGEVTKTTLAGFDAVKFRGSYLRDNARRYIAQMTVVIPGNDDALYVLQLNADAPLEQDQVIREAARVIDEGTTITV